MTFGESINDIRKTFTDIQEIIKVEEHFLASCQNPTDNTLQYIISYSLSICLTI